jgi:hypothetical protein
MDDDDFRDMLSGLSPYEQAQVFCLSVWRLVRRPRRKWDLETADVVGGFSKLITIVLTVFFH